MIFYIISNKRLAYVMPLYECYWYYVIDLLYNRLLPIAWSVHPQLKRLLIGFSFEWRGESSNGVKITTCHRRDKHSCQVGVITSRLDDFRGCKSIVRAESFPDADYGQLRCSNDQREPSSRITMGTFLSLMTMSSARSTWLRYASNERLYRRLSSQICG